MSEWRGGPRGAAWSEIDRLLYLGLRAYEDDLCRCGWPRTYTMHDKAHGHWSASQRGVRCQACAASAAAEEQARKTEGKKLAGLYFPVRPSQPMLQAMANPRLRPIDDEPPPVLVGASGRLVAREGDPFNLPESPPDHDHDDHA